MIINNIHIIIIIIFTLGFIIFYEARNELNEFKYGLNLFIYYSIYIVIME